MPMDVPMLFLATSDPARARGFYEQIMGLPFVSDDAYALVFRVGGLTLRIQKVEHVCLAPYTSLGWRVHDIEGEVKRLAKRGVAFERYDGLAQDTLGIWVTPGGGRVAWFKDPDGNTLSLTQPPE